MHGSRHFNSFAVFGQPSKVPAAGRQDPEPLALASGVSPSDESSSEPAASAVGSQPNLLKSTPFGLVPVEIGLKTKNSLQTSLPPARGRWGADEIRRALGAVAVVTKHEIVLAIVGGLFVLETVSVIVQVLSYKWTGRRVFRMAPLHHHFEQKGWAEPTIVFRFWIIAAILAMAGLATLKLR